MKACHDFNNGFTLFTAAPVLFIMYTNKDSNLISEVPFHICTKTPKCIYVYEVPEGFVKHPNICRKKMKCAYVFMKPSLYRAFAYEKSALPQ